MKNLIVYIIMIVFGMNASFGQTITKEWQQIIEEKPPIEYRMHSNLYHLAKYVGNDRSKRRSVHRKQMPEMITRDDDRINVEIVYSEDLNKEIDESLLSKIGVIVTSTWKNRASCWLYTDELLDIAVKLPADYVMLPVYEQGDDNQGPGLMNSGGYNNGGATGSGLRIAILDGGFDMLSEAIVAGVVPLGYGANYDWSGGGLQGGSQHGTACLESAYDHAPDATYYLHRVTNATQMGNAVNQAISDGVDIISHSASRYNTGWNDNSGPACSAAQDAVDAGMLFFTSAGNRNGTHWQGEFEDDDNDNWHEWSGADERNNFDVNGDGVVRLRLQWDSPSFFDYYDLFLYDASNNSILASSTSNSSFEELFWTNPSSFSARNVYVAVRGSSSAGSHPTFELFNHDTGNDDFQHFSTSASTTSPSNCTAGNVISVGAVSRFDYTSLPGTSNIIEDFSSRGPSNEGSSVLDLVAPDLTTAWVYGGNFSGTSCSTPNAAGAAAAFWSANPNLSATGVRQILFRKADLYKDWGSIGYDNIYGRGGFMLYDYFSTIRYILSTSGNGSGSNQRAYLNMEQADANAPNNARVVFLGGTYQEPPAGFVFTKPLTYVSAVISSQVE